jgi:hypothetical protein
VTVHVSDPGFQEAFLRDAAVFVRNSVPIEFDFGTCIMLIGQLQLALRHPKNTGPSAIVARQVVEKLIGRVGLTETLRVGLLAGFDPSCDVERR